MCWNFVRCTRWLIWCRANNYVTDRLFSYIFTLIFHKVSPIFSIIWLLSVMNAMSEIWHGTYCWKCHHTFISNEKIMDIQIAWAFCSGFHEIWHNSKIVSWPQTVVEKNPKMYSHLSFSVPDYKEWNSLFPQFMLILVIQVIYIRLGQFWSSNLGLCIGWGRKLHTHCKMIKYRGSDFILFKSNQIYVPVLFIFWLLALKTKYSPQPKINCAVMIKYIS